MVKLSKQKDLLIERIAKSFTLVNASDRNTIITRDIALAAIPTIKQLSSDIVQTFPKYNSKRVRNGVENAKQAVTVLRELLRMKDRKILSIKKYKWDKQLKKNCCEFTYKVL